MALRKSTMSESQSERFAKFKPPLGCYCIFRRDDSRVASFRSREVTVLRSITRKVKSACIGSPFMAERLNSNRYFARNAFLLPQRHGHSGPTSAGICLGVEIVTAPLPFLG